MELMKNEPDTLIYYVDDSDIDKCLYREKGRDPRGKKISAKKTRGMKFAHKSIVSGKYGYRVAASLAYDHTMHSFFV